MVLKITTLLETEFLNSLKKLSLRTDVEYFFLLLFFVREVIENSSPWFMTYSIAPSL